MSSDAAWDRIGQSYWYLVDIIYFLSVFTSSRCQQRPLDIARLTVMHLFVFLLPFVWNVSIIATGLLASIIERRSHSCITCSLWLICRYCLSYWLLYAYEITLTAQANAYYAYRFMTSFVCRLMQGDELSLSDELMSAEVDNYKMSSKR